jgi:hypothetical protein
MLQADCGAFPADPPGIQRHAQRVAPVVGRAKGRAVPARLRFRRKRLQPGTPSSPALATLREPQWAARSTKGEPHMQALLIDPTNRTITTAELPDTGDKLPAIYKHLQCDTFDAVTLPNGDALYVDDEGLLKPLQHFFAVRGMPEPFAGRGLVVGTDSRGRSVTPAITQQELSGHVKFIELITKQIAIVRDATNPNGQERILPLNHILKTLATEADEC